MYKIYLSFILVLMFSSAGITQEKKKKDWDVSNPPGNWGWKDVKFNVDEGTWMNLDVSPDGKTIVFDLLGDIYSMPISGGKASAIRKGLPWEVQPRFSPDGKRCLLYTSPSPRDATLSRMPSSA